MKGSKSNLVFARPDGSMREDADNDSEEMQWWARRDSNPLPPASEAGTLSR
jgi:hypothetical protein